MKSSTGVVEQRPIAFEQQLKASPEDAQRRIFLGLSLAYLGRKTDALPRGAGGPRATYRLAAQLRIESQCLSPTAPGRDAVSISLEEPGWSTERRAELGPKTQQPPGGHASDLRRGRR